MGWTLSDDWLAQFRPRLIGKSALGAALKTYGENEKTFGNSLVDASAADPEPYESYRAAWRALDRVEEARLAAVGQDKLASMGLAPFLKPGVITTRQNRLRDALADFIADAPGGINHIIDLSASCESHISTRATVVSQFERAQMSAARCRIPASLRRLRQLRADLDAVMKSGLIAPEDVVEKSGELHRILSDLPGDFSCHLKALAMLRTAGLRLGHHKKPLWDWLKRADAVLEKADA